MKLKSILCTLALTLGTSLILSTSAHAFGSSNLLKNGDFTEVFENGLPAEWEKFSSGQHYTDIDSSVTVQQEGDSSFLQIIRNDSGGGEYGQQVAELDPSVTTVYVSLKGRVRNLIAGDAVWQHPGVAFAWILSNGGEREIGPDRWLMLKDSSEVWVPLESTLEKPENAVGLRVAFIGAGWTGEAEFEEVTVEALE